MYLHTVMSYFMFRTPIIFNVLYTIIYISTRYLLNICLPMIVEIITYQLSHFSPNNRQYFHVKFKKCIYYTHIYDI